MKLICYPKCGTCAKAQKYLDDKGITYDYRDIKMDHLTFEELKKWYEMSRLPLKRFFNTSGIIYQSNHLKDKLPLMSEEEQLHLLASDGMLVKRPLVIDGDTVLIGFKEKEWDAHFIK